MSGEALLVGAAVASPILAFVGGSVGSRLAARSDNRLDKWRRREEVMRTIRWAAEKAVDADNRVCEIGYAALEGLAASEMLQSEDRRFLVIVKQQPSKAGDHADRSGYWNRRGVMRCGQSCW